jgi:hypothetical protein
MRRVQLCIGDRVHYRSHGSPILIDGTQIHAPKCRPADVIEHLGAEVCILFVKNPSGVFFDDCRHDETRWPDAPPGEGGTWHYPCDVSP